LLKKVEEKPKNLGKTFTAKVIEQLIFETDDFGTAGRFKIFNENREAAFRALVEEQAVETIDQTRTRIAENYKKVIDPYFEDFFKDQQPDEYDIVKITYYLTYLLDRVSIVEIRIERDENVAMIFEVVNDRGLGLRPYEILKGKLIGSLSAGQKEQANAIWTELQERYFKAKLKYATEKRLNLDMFFQTYFRAKFSNSENEYESFEGDYHYEMYRNDQVRAYFGDYKDKDLLFKRITEDIKYFAELYLELRTSYAYEPLIFNKILDQNQQYLLIMSAMKLDDPERSEKIASIANKFDQFHTVLRLLDAYNSSSFQRLIYPLNKDVRAKPLVKIPPLFDVALIERLVATEVLQKGQCSRATEVFDFERFKRIRNRWKNFSKYILMRIDRYLAKLLDKPSYASEELKLLERRFNKNNRRKYGMHLEHIYTQHDANRALFTTNGHFDESAFQQKRNLLGMVLLLKDRQNISSSNEVYKDKQQTYAQSNLIWNELLVGSIPSIDRKALPLELQVEVIQPVNQVFPLAAVDARQQVTFEAIKHIWGCM